MKNENEKELRELNVFCAERVMGWRRVKRDMTRDNDFIVHGGDVLHRLIEGASLHIFKPTTNPGDAMLVLQKCADKCEADKMAIVIEKDGSDWIVCAMFFGSNYESSFEAKADTLPRAIALFSKALFQPTETREG